MLTKGIPCPYNTDCAAYISEGGDAKDSGISDSVFFITPASLTTMYAQVKHEVRLCYMEPLSAEEIQKFGAGGL